MRREREAWTAERALVGQFKYLQVCRVSFAACVLVIIGQQ